MQVVPVLLSLLDGISTIRIYVPKDLRSAEARQGVGKNLKEVLRRFPDGVPLLDPIDDMQIDDSAFKKLIRRIESLEDRLLSKKEFKKDDILDRCALFERKLELEKQIKV